MMFMAKSNRVIIIILIHHDRTRTALEEGGNISASKIYAYKKLASISLCLSTTAQDSLSALDHWRIPREQNGGERASW
jgi:hypothetical protein